MPAPWFPTTREDKTTTIHDDVTRTDLGITRHVKRGACERGVGREGGISQPSPQKVKKKSSHITTAKYRSKNAPCGSSSRRPPRGSSRPPPSCPSFLRPPSPSCCVSAWSTSISVQDRWCVSSAGVAFHHLWTSCLSKMATKEKNNQYVRVFLRDHLIDSYWKNDQFALKVRWSSAQQIAPVLHMHSKECGERVRWRSYNCKYTTQTALLERI